MNPVSPALDHVFDIRARIGAPLRGGPGPNGVRVHIPITGGVVSGPRLNGRVLSGGYDWLRVRDDGNSEIDARYTIEADDGTPIYVRNNGLRVSSPQVLERLKTGLPVAPNEMYFRSAPVFDAPIGPHGWLSDRLFVASLSRDGDDMVVQVFVVG